LCAVALESVGIFVEIGAEDQSRAEKKGHDKNDNLLVTRHRYWLPFSPSPARNLPELACEPFVLRGRTHSDPEVPWQIIRVHLADENTLVFQGQADFLGFFA